MYSETENKPSLTRRILVAIGLGLGGGLAGFAVGYFFGHRVTRWEDDVNLVMATSLIGLGMLLAGAMVFKPSMAPKGSGMLQVFVLVLAGLMLLGPMFGQALASPGVIFGGVVVLLVLQTAINLRLWFQADEMLRRVMLETSAMAFWVLQGALFVYAAAERLELVESITAWGMVGIMMAVYLGASAVAAARRGMG